MLRDSAELLYCNLLFKFTIIVRLSVGNLGNMLTVLDTSAGTLTTFDVFLTAFPLELALVFEMQVLEQEACILIHSSQKNLVLVENAFHSQQQQEELYILLSNCGMFYTTALYFGHLQTFFCHSRVGFF